MDKEEFYARLAAARKDMDCESMHCSGCPYYNGINCDLSESIYSGE